MGRRLVAPEETSPSRLGNGIRPRRDQAATPVATAGLHGRAPAEDGNGHHGGQGIVVFDTGSKQMSCGGPTLVSRQ